MTRRRLPRRCARSASPAPASTCGTRSRRRPDHPLLQLDNVIATPHTAGLTPEARTTMGRIAAEQLLDCLDGKRPPRMVNPEVWPAYAERFSRAFGIATAA